MLFARYSRSFWLLLPLVCCFLSGCSKLETVEGVVTLDGKPLEQIGSITFMPEEEGKKPAVAPIMPGGVFSLYTSNKDGVMRGKFKVVISCVKQGKELLPPTYSSTRQTILTFEVPKGGSRDVRFDLNTKGTAPGS